MITMEELREALEPIRRSTGKRLTPDDWQFYLTALNAMNVPEAEIRRAAALHALESTYFPKPAELLRHISIQEGMKHEMKIDPLMAWEAIREVWYQRIRQLQGGRPGISERELFPLVKRDYQNQHPSLRIPSSAYAGVDDVRAESRKTNKKPFGYDHAPAPRWTDIDGFNRWCQLPQSERYQAGAEQSRFEAIWRGTLDVLRRRKIVQRVPRREYHPPAERIAELREIDEAPF